MDTPDNSLKVAAAKVMGVSQPDVSRMLKGHFRDVSVERIMRMLTRLGTSYCSAKAPNIAFNPDGFAAG
jgi:predicted XRE-type DNA-binding protein